MCSESIGSSDNNNIRHSVNLESCVLRETSSSIIARSVTGDGTIGAGVYASPPRQSQAAEDSRLRPRC